MSDFFRVVAEYGIGTTIALTLAGGVAWLIRFSLRDPVSALSQSLNSMDKLHQRHLEELNRATQIIDDERERNRQLKKANRELKHDNDVLRKQVGALTERISKVEKVQNGED